MGILQSSINTGTMDFSISCCSMYMTVLSRLDIKVLQFVDIWERTNAKAIDLSNTLKTFSNTDMEESKWQLLHPPIYLYDSNSFIVSVVQSLSLDDEPWKKNIWYCFPKGRNLVYDAVAILIVGSKLRMPAKV